MKELKETLSIVFYFFKYRYFSKFKSREHLFHWQNKKLRQHLKWVVKNSSYYRDLLKGDFDIPLEKIPIMNKSELMANFDSVNTVGLKKTDLFDKIKKAEITREFKKLVLKDTIFGTSSGTSGKPGIFLATSKERSRYIGTIMGKAKQNHLFWKNRLALILRSNSPLYETKSKKRYQFKYFDPALPFEKTRCRLKFLQPNSSLCPPLFSC